MSTVKYGPECVSGGRQIFLHVREQESTARERDRDTAGLGRWE